MGIEKDIQSALNLINNIEVDQTQYRKVQICTDHSLKYYKKYKLDGKNVLVRIENYYQLADLISYKANVKCFSDNKFDKYFLELFLSSFKLHYQNHVNFFLKNDKSLSKDNYNVFKDKLSDKTRYFFDELYKKYSSSEIYDGLIVREKYTYTDFLKCVRYLLKPKYNLVSNKLNNSSIDYLYCTMQNINQVLDETYDFIDLSYNFIQLQEFNEIVNITKNFIPYLSQNGKIQVFTTSDDAIILDGYKKIQTRSIDDVDSSKDECKVEYAYVYSK